MDDAALKTLVQSGYDRLAQKYAQEFWTELTRKPFDRDLLARFSNLLPKGSWVADIGCGPCQVGRVLADGGHRVVGVDLSTEMLMAARALNPDLPFVCQDMRSLALKSSGLDGIVAFYSLIHLFEEGMGQALREFYRVLRPGGLVCLSMHGGTGPLRVESMLGEPVPMFATLVNLEALVAGLAQAGFVVEEALSRPPYEFEYGTQRLYAVARKKGQS